MVGRAACSRPARDLSEFIGVLCPPPTDMATTARTEQRALPCAIEFPFLSSAFSTLLLLRKVGGLCQPRYTI